MRFRLVVTLAAVALMSMPRLANAQGFTGGLRQALSMTRTAWCRASKCRSPTKRQESNAR